MGTFREEKYPSDLIVEEIIAEIHGGAIPGVAGPLSIGEKPSSLRERYFMKKDQHTCYVTKEAIDLKDITVCLSLLKREAIKCLHKLKRIGYRAGTGIIMWWAALFKLVECPIEDIAGKFSSGSVDSISPFVPPSNSIL